MFCIKSLSTSETDKTGNSVTNFILEGILVCAYIVGSKIIVLLSTEPIASGSVELPVLLTSAEPEETPPDEPAVTDTETEADILPEPWTEVDPDAEEVIESPETFVTI
jgi:hypothetical protein